ncbi:DUF4190 domain-containing protein [Arthrobacter sp. JSM 101049]|uniref:DUF4190 domain-containing protein n=1 Tax=Arthrobacter sp. JSM 101049 TaxID=929097 RepID=UPI00356A7E46
MTEPNPYLQNHQPQQGHQQYGQQPHTGGYPAGPPGAYGQPYAPPPRGMSITSLVLGLASILTGFTLLVPIVGLVFGFLGLQREPAGRGMSIAGLILNGVMLLGWALVLVFAVIIAGGLYAAVQQSGVSA